MPAPQLLVSVRSLSEAQTALAGGADIIDVKEPNRGSLGRADFQITQAIADTLSINVPISAALGELLEFDFPPTYPPGISWVKAGLAGSRNVNVQVVWRQLAESVCPARLLGVYYADYERIQGADFVSVLDLVSESNSHSPNQRGILIDTAIKDGLGLLHWKNLKELLTYRELCDKAGCFLALAGSLSASKIAFLCREVQPHIIAVRGAACEQDNRSANINQKAVTDLKVIIRANS